MRFLEPASHRWHRCRGLRNVLEQAELDDDDAPDGDTKDSGKKYSFDSPALAGNEIEEIMKSPNSRAKGQATGKASESNGSGDGDDVRAARCSRFCSMHFAFAMRCARAGHAPIRCLADVSAEGCHDCRSTGSCARLMTPCACRRGCVSRA
jgi:hypothetical protein